METRHKFESITVRMRRIDYARIRHTFPSLPAETAHSYFRRLALHLKKIKLEYLENDL